MSSVEPPIIFLSAVTRDFGLEFIKDIGNEIHNALECVCKNRSNLQRSGKILAEKLRDEIARASCVIHLVGPGFGFGPEDVPDALDVENAATFWQPACRAWWPYPGSFPARRSYTQMEFDFATQLGKPVFVIFVDDPALIENSKSQSPDEARLQSEHRRAIKTRGNEYIGTESVSTIKAITERLPIIVDHLKAKIGELHDWIAEVNRRLEDLAQTTGETRKAIEQSRDFIIAGVSRTVEEALERIDAHDAEAEARRAAAPKPPRLPPAPPPRKPSWLSQFFWGRDQVKNRERMLKLVRFYQIDGILHEAVREMNQIEIDWKLAPDAVIKHADMDDLLVSTGQGFASIFHRIMDRQVLILGARGSGKTILLLQLCEVLLKAAEKPENKGRPIPIVLNLSSWAEKKLPLDDWIVEETHLSYLVPRRVVRQWCEQNTITPLLDGLDEVKLEHRRACLDAIQVWRTRHSVRGMAVCSRIDDYEALQSKFELPTAIRLQPLTDAQINPVLERDNLVGLRALLEKEPWFRDELRTVLILNFAAYAYANIDEPALRLPAESDDVARVHARLKHLYDTYITRRFEDPSTDSGIPETKLRRFLGWLATKMVERNHTRFHLENLQIDWLNTKTGRICFAFTSMIASALAVVVPSMVMIATINELGAAADKRDWIAWQCLIAVVVFIAGLLGIHAAATAVILDWRGNWMASKWPRRLLEASQILTLCVAVEAIFIGACRHFFLGPPILRAAVKLAGDNFPPVNEVFTQRFIQALAMQRPFGVLDETTVMMPEIASGLLVMILVTLVFPQKFCERPAAFALAAFGAYLGAEIPGIVRDGIAGGEGLKLIVSLAVSPIPMVSMIYFGTLGTTVEAGRTQRGYSWAFGAVFGLLIGAFVLPLSIAATYLFEAKMGWEVLKPSLVWGTLGAIAGGIIAGVRRSQGVLKDGGMFTSRTNQGITDSIRGALRFYLTCFVVFGAFGFVLQSLGWGIMKANWEVTESTPMLERLRASAMFGGGVAAGFGLLSGIENSVKHYLLRIYLLIIDRVPWCLGTYAEAGIRKFVLRRFGGGFEFSHRTLRDHFATMESEAQETFLLSRKASLWERPRVLVSGLLAVWLVLFWPQLSRKLDRSEQLKIRADSLAKDSKDKTSEAEKLLREALLDKSEQLKIRADALINDSKEKASEAEKLLREALEFSIHRNGADHENTIALLFHLGENLCAQDHLKEADVLFREAISRARKSLAPDDLLLTGLLKRHANNLEKLSLESKDEKLQAEVADTYREIIRRMEQQYVVPCVATCEPLGKLTNFLLLAG